MGACTLYAGLRRVGRELVVLFDVVRSVVVWCGPICLLRFVTRVDD